MGKKKRKKKNKLAKDILLINVIIAVINLISALVNLLSSFK